jgi:hypothetical protein
MGNVLSDDKQQQVLALGRLGWSVRRIQVATGVRRETASGYWQDQPTCVAHGFKSTCVQTVNQLEACLEKIGSDLCNDAALMSPECNAVMDCLG